MIHVIRYDESNPNVEGIKGNYGQDGQKDYSLTLIKNVLFVVLYDGATLKNVKIPTCYDGFLNTNMNRIIEIRDSVINAELMDGENARGFLVLKKWN